MIVGIVGFLDSGKNTVGNIFKNYGFVEESFAKPLKDACSNIFGWPRHLLEGDTSQSRKFRETVDPYWSEILNDPEFTPRKALQLMGTEAGRNVFGENLWTASCIRRCQGIELRLEDLKLVEVMTSTSCNNYIITDCRFINEINAIRESNGAIVRIKRGLEPKWFDGLYNIPLDNSSEREQYMKIEAPNIHQSEWDWVGCRFDSVLNNDGTLADLQKNVYNTMIDLKIYHKPFVGYDSNFNPVIAKTISKQ
jgi:hypothetical protein